MFNRFHFILSNRLSIQRIGNAQIYVLIDSAGWSGDLFRLSIDSIYSREEKKRVTTVLLGSYSGSTYAAEKVTLQTSVDKVVGTPMFGEARPQRDLTIRGSSYDALLPD